MNCGDVRPDQYLVATYDDEQRCRRKTEYSRPKFYKLYLDFYNGICHYHIPRHCILLVKKHSAKIAQSKCRYHAIRNLMHIYGYKSYYVYIPYLMWKIDKTQALPEQLVSDLGVLFFAAHNVYTAHSKNRKKMIPFSLVTRCNLSLLQVLLNNELLERDYNPLDYKAYFPKLKHHPTRRKNLDVYKEILKSIKFCESLQ